MQGLTTRFSRPPAPARGLISREGLGIPPRPSSFTQSFSSCLGDARHDLGEEVGDGYTVEKYSGERCETGIAVGWQMSNSIKSLPDVRSRYNFGSS